MIKTVTRYCQFLQHSFIYHLATPTSLLATRFIMILSGRFMVLATTSTTNLACCLVGQSNRLYRTVCLRVHRRPSSSANSTVVTLLFWLPEEELLKCFSKSVAAWFAVAFSPVSCYRDVTKLRSNYQCTSYKIWASLSEPDCIA